MSNVIDSQLFRNMVISAAACLSNHREEVDNMNVFPVPDGDTGTNMSMTMDACEQAILSCEANDLPTLAKTVANAALRGARGNSGVILSQLMRGVQKALSDATEIDCVILSLAVQSAAKSAYKAVMKPTEGTILTVARKMAEFAEKNVNNYESLTEFACDIVSAGDIALSKTPDMLPQLKQAGVVDSGGQGLMYICKGALEALKGASPISRTEGNKVAPKVSVAGSENTDIKFKYCTECIIDKADKKLDSFKLKLALEPKGDSMVVVDDEDIIKIHIHTNSPDFVLGEALKYGELSNIKIENMKLQHNGLSVEAVSEIKNSNVPAKKYGFVCVAAGKGLSDTFKKLGVDTVIEGGQTMNPSTDDILSAVESVNAENIFIYPNNKNIIMAAQQACELSSKNVMVIPTTTIVQAMSSILVFDEDSEPEANFDEMCEVISEVKSAQITYAVRDTVVNDKEISPGDILGILEGKIFTVDKTVEDSVSTLLDTMVTDDSSVITIFYGEDIKSEDAENLKTCIEEKFDDCDVYMHFGGQPVYYYFISVE